ncbi:hypothetical protein AXG93_1154s1810 [Marchantia polymorpha subsp. ruderalis]|uniref:AB hydrolase-1 domain-containing protein n=1 Tax=Marchantia polymorpha subsp. ruderalis TaxID=1480154 RepID=A0A176WT79_MARPO|nr:hypothetical protein AXG93_1154s1810 [Marchantia polymorpha subsp. ruderalis]
MAAYSCFKGSGLVVNRPFFSAFSTARRLEGANLLQIRRTRGNWVGRDVVVSFHKNGFSAGRGGTRLVQLGKTESRGAPSAASSSSLGGGAWVQDDDDSQEGKEKQKKKEKVRRLIAGVDQTQLVDPWLLADADSRFAEFYGVQIHHKIARPAADSSANSEEKVVGLPAILLHGFGASLFSWERIMPKLAQVFGESVVAFDRPAFGLTSRAFPPSPQTSEKTKLKFNNIYSVAFSAAAAVAFVNFIKAEKAVLIGHSAGSIIAAEAYHQAPEKFAALILVAPALVAPIVMRQMDAEKKSRERETKLEEDLKSRRASPVLKAWAAILWAFSKILDVLRSVRVFLVLNFSKLVGRLLRSPPGIWLVRRIMDKGGPAAVRMAFYDVTKADKYVLDGYTKPLGCRDWERALVEYCLALIDNSEEKASGKKRIEDITCPVLVVTGDTDRIVPDWNAERLAKVFPNAEFKRIKNCGHLPQEETPDELTEIIKDFLTRNVQFGSATSEPAAIPVA